MSAKRAREAAFNVYASNLSTCFPEVTDTFLCPICKTPFGRDALEEPPGVILAHCVPKALGGTLKTLACAACDNTAGHDVEIHLKNRLEAEDFFAGRSPRGRRVWVTVGPHKVRGSLEIKIQSGGTVGNSVFLDEAKSPPESYHGLVTDLHEGRAQLEIPTIYVEGDLEFSMRMTYVAMLRAAFLMMFRQFGYGYILNPNLDRVRAQLCRPDEPVLPSWPVLNLSIGTEYGNTVGIITSPAEMRAFFVPMCYKTEGKSSVTKAVIMPGLDNEDRDQVYERIAAAQQANPHWNGKCTIFKYEAGRLSQPDSKTFPYRVWRAFTR
jgi:hypothetical protein